MAADFGSGKWCLGASPARTGTCKEGTVLRREGAGAQSGASHDVAQAQRRGWLQRRERFPELLHGSMEASGRSFDRRKRCVRGGKQVWRGRPLQRRRTAWSMTSAHRCMTWAGRSAVRQQRVSVVVRVKSRSKAVLRRYRLCSVKGCGGVADVSAEQRLRRERGRRNLTLQKEDETESGSNGFSFSIHKKGPHCARVIQR